MTDNSTNKTIMKKILTITIGIAILAVAAMAMVTRNHAVKDSYFEPDTDKLHQAPANILVVRPTRFPNAPGKVNHYHEGDNLARTVGRNVSFQRMMAEANDCDFAQVILPQGTPQGHFDFLVTMHGHVRQQLRAAIQKQFGYTAHHENRTMDVLILTVADPSLPGLTVSGDNESSDARYENGKLYLTHKSLDTIVGAVEQGLKTPIIDQTGLTNNYDFAVTWNENVQKRLDDGGFTLDGTRKALAQWGLELKPETRSMDVVVVEKQP